jgi:hypothetical protein
MLKRDMIGCDGCATAELVGGDGCDGCDAELRNRKAGRLRRLLNLILQPPNPNNSWLRNSV